MRVTKEAAERKQEILDTALEILMEKGYEKTSVKDIVSKVGVAQGLFYYYFASKEDMVKQICEQYGQKLFTIFHDMGFDRCKDAMDATKILIDGMFRFVKENARFLKKIHEKGNRTLHDIITFTMIAQMAKALRSVIELGNTQGKFHCDYPDQSAIALIYGTFSALHHEDGEILLDNIETEKEFILSFVSRILVVDQKILEEII